MEPEPNFWERPDVVADFAARAPDQRLQELLPQYDDPRSTRVLDIGCAGGRNTVLLAQQGFDVHAIDASAAMVAETRRRVAPLLGDAEARQRIRVGRMDDLSDFADASIDLVVALGILHNAGSRAEWGRAAGEAARVLRPGGRLLVAHFSPETDLTGEGVRPVPGEAHVYDGLPAGRATLLSAPELDAAMARFGLAPSTPTTMGATKTERGRRVSVNALYRKG
ncbi:MAG TPA: class I SAM-dependent methyltransferase [Longimicrobiales bacterium]|nr:class I SAM-dependent methyltransferase [Longimicrobiales bacterium]